ncbi:TonB-dependent receptor [Fulvivirga sp.]|uniref:TonB-dependent receptor domain-containing protein n=1 Tax=Fulvivirga sp. TaxID=1931237 RepID=UPI0032EAE9CE
MGIRFQYVLADYSVQYNLNDGCPILMKINKMKSINTLLLILLGALITLTSYAQESVQIKLLDKEDATPIVGATYLYGDQQGMSDEDGVISFRYTESDIMKLSHISYGSWEFGPQKIKDLAGKQYSRKKTSVNLYPVTIIGVRPGQQPDERVNIDYQERMQHDGAAILNQIPAFNSIRKGGNYGFDPVFRGFKFDQLNIVLNGAQSATAACPNRMDPPTSQMAPNMMERIEVLKGPYSLRFGTGFGATINFIPLKPRFVSASKVYGRLSSGYESNGNIVRGEGQIGLSGSKYDLSLFGSWSEGNDYQTGNSQTVPAGFLRGSFGANLGVKLSEYQQLAVSAIYNMARDADFAALAMDLREDNTWMFNARHDIQIQKGNLKSWNTTVFGSFVDHLMDNLLKPLDPRMMNAETAATTYNYGGRTESVWQFSNSKLFSGADLRVEGADGTRVREFLMGPNAGNIVKDNVWQDGRISKTGLFAEFQTVGMLFNYVFSGRVEVNQATVNEATAEFVTVYPETEISQINPSFSMGMIKSLGNNASAGLWLGRAQRSAGLTERFINYFPVGQDPYEMLGNPQLDPEVNNQIDLTIKWQTGSSNLNLDLFAAYMQDYISSVIDTDLTPRIPSSPGVRQFINIQDAYKTGFEFTWTQNLTKSLKHLLGMAYTYAQDLERDQALPEIPPLDVRYVLIGSYLSNKLKPEVVVRHALEQSGISEEFGETATPSFTTLDIKVGYSFTEKFKLQTGVNNLFNENFYEHLSRSVRGTSNPIYAPGRNWFMSLSVNF